MREIVFLDMVGVLSYPVKKYVETDIAEYRNIPSLSVTRMMGENWREFYTGKIKEDDFWEKTRRKMKLDNVNEIRQNAYERMGLDEEVVKTVLDSRNGSKLGILSNQPAEWFERQLEGTELKEAVDVAAISGYVGVMKPDYRIYMRALEAAKVIPEDATLIDDKPDNVEAARHVGMRAVEFKGIEYLRSQMSSATV